MWHLLRSLIISFLFFWLRLYSGSCDAGQMRVIAVALERPALVYVNTSFVRVYNLTSRRMSRRDPTHYIRFLVQLYVPFDNNCTVDVRIDEFLSNTYRPTFVVRQMKMCLFISTLSHKLLYATNMSGPFNTFEYKSNLATDNCLLPAGVYDFQNISWPTKYVPEYFPFQKGRMYLKFLMEGVNAGSLYVDIELKLLPKLKCTRLC